MNSERVCCSELSKFKVVYDGGSCGNDIILICKNHINKHPFDKRIISIGIIED